MMSAIVQEAPSTGTVAIPQKEQATTVTVGNSTIQPHVLLVGKKYAVDYIAPALFRLGQFGELLIRAKGSLSIVTAVNVAEMVKRDVPGLETRPIRVGTEEILIDGTTRRVSFIEIHLAKPVPQARLPVAVKAADIDVVVATAAPATVRPEPAAVVAAALAEPPASLPLPLPSPAEKLAEAAAKSKRIRKKASSSATTTTAAAKKKTAAAATTRKRATRKKASPSSSSST